MKFRIYINGEATDRIVEGTSEAAVKASLRREFRGTPYSVKEVRDMIPGEAEYNRYHDWEMAVKASRSPRTSLDIIGLVVDGEETESRPVCPLTEAELAEAKKYADFIGVKMTI